MSPARALTGGAAALAVALAALWLARQAGVSGVGAVDEVARALAAAALLWGLSGYAVARLAVPVALRPHWPLLVLPCGAMTSALALAALGFAYVPFGVSLPLVLAAGAASALWAERRVRRRSRPDVEAARAAGPSGPLPEPGGRGLRLGWPAYLAVVLVCVSLLPVFRTGFSTVVGTSGDAHLAAGMAELVKHVHPTGRDPTLPLDEAHLTWRSKFPIYYGFAAVSELSGLDPVRAFAPLSAALLALAALGFGLCAHYLLRAGPVASLLAMGLIGANGMVFFTVNHPYMNQTWGLVAMGYVLLFAWWAIREPRAPTIGLLACFTAIAAFAYPLMLAFPAMAIAGFLATRVYERRREGRPVDWAAPLRRLPRRSWLYPLYGLAAIAFAIPAFGVFEKVVSGAAVVLSGRSLAAWSGDLRSYIPAAEFLSLPALTGLGAALLVGAIALLALWGLRDAPRAVAVGFLAVALTAGAFAWMFSERAFGWYFYFKVLAFLGPMVVIAAAAGLGRLGRPGGPAWLRAGAVALAAAYLAAGTVAVRDQVEETYPQVHENLLELEGWAEDIPAGASVRVDLDPESQPWVSWFLHTQPLSTRDPLTWTGYPFLATSRKADYVLADPGALKPFDAEGPPLRRNANFALYRMRDDVPGPDRSSLELRRSIESVPLL